MAAELAALAFVFAARGLGVLETREELRVRGQRPGQTHRDGVVRVGRRRHVQVAHEKLGVGEVARLQPRASFS